MAGNQDDEGGDWEVLMVAENTASVISQQDSSLLILSPTYCSALRALHQTRPIEPWSEVTWISVSRGADLVLAERPPEELKGAYFPDVKPSGMSRTSCFNCTVLG